MTTSNTAFTLRDRLLDRLRPGELGELTTSDRVRLIVSSVTTAFPDGELIVHWSAATDDRLVVGGRFEGTHLGPWRGVAATGSRVSVLGMISLLVADGMVQDINTVVDSLAIAEQLGVVAPLQAPACRLREDS